MTRLPSTWTPPPEYARYAFRNTKWTAARFEQEAKLFLAYWLARKGRAGARADWFAEWKKWCAPRKPNRVVKPRAI